MQEKLENVVECQKELFAYFNALETYSEMASALAAYFFFPKMKCVSPSLKSTIYYISITCMGCI